MWQPWAVGLGVREGEQVTGIALTPEPETRGSWDGLESPWMTTLERPRRRMGPANGGPSMECLEPRGARTLSSRWNGRPEHRRAESPRRKRSDEAHP